MENKLAGYEKMLVKAIVAMHRERGYELKASNIEYEVAKVTNLYNIDHRYMVEDYAEEVMRH